MDYTDVAKDRDIEVCRKRYCPSFWKQLKPVIKRILSINLRVIVRTVRLFTAFPMQALFKFEIIRVKLLLFPSMTVWASIFKTAAIFIRCNKIFRMPIFAHIL
jgi:hypothetical protein